MNRAPVINRARAICECRPFQCIYFYFQKNKARCDSFLPNKCPWGSWEDLTKRDTCHRLPRKSASLKEEAPAAAGKIPPSLMSQTLRIIVVCRKNAPAAARKILPNLIHVTKPTNTICAEKKALGARTTFTRLRFRKGFANFYAWLAFQPIELRSAMR